MPTKVLLLWLRVSAGLAHYMHMSIRSLCRWFSPHWNTAVTQGWVRCIRRSIHTQPTACESVIDLHEVSGYSIQTHRRNLQSSHELWGHCCRLKTQELKNIRRLAHEVLLQRSDVETFLLSSLKQVTSCRQDRGLRPVSGHIAVTQWVGCWM